MIEWPSKDMEITVRAERLEELRRKEDELIEALEEIAHLKREVEHRLAEMNLQARWTREAQEKVASLRAALKPFAEFAGVYVRHAATRDDATVVAAAGDMVANAPVTIGDCRAALKALE